MFLKNSLEEKLKRSKSDYSPKVEKSIEKKKIKGFLTHSKNEKLIFLFNNDILPVVFESGSLGASGDLAPLAHISLTLIGEGEVNYKGSKMNSKDVLDLFFLHNSSHQIFLY